MGESYKFGYWGKTSEEILKNQFPLHRCCRDGDVETLAALLEEPNHGIYIEDSFYGWTPAHWAAYFGKLSCLRKLITACSGLNCNIPTVRFQQTPSHVAAYGGHPSLLQWLLQSGANIHVKDYLGETALHKAARTGSMECVSLLVAHGADLNLQNNNLHTAAQLAKACGYYECSRYLTDAQQQSLLNTTAITHQNGHSEQNGAHSAQNVEMDSMDCDMDTVDSAPTSLASTPFLSNPGPAGDVGCHSNSISDPSNGCHGASDTGGAVSIEGNGSDILLNSAVSGNHVSVAGRKRPREDGEYEQTKRTRTVHPASSLTTQNQTGSNISTCPEFINPILQPYTVIQPESQATKDMAESSSTYDVTTMQPGSLQQVWENSREHSSHNVGTRNLGETSGIDENLDDSMDCQTNDVLFAIEACLSASSSILSVPITPMSRPTDDSFIRRREVAPHEHQTTEGGSEQNGVLERNDDGNSGESGSQGGQRSSRRPRRAVFAI